MAGTSPQTLSTLSSTDLTATRVRTGGVSWVRAAVVAPLAMAGACFVAYPALRPFSDETSVQGARAFASGRWIAAHTLGIAGFVLLAVALFGVYELLTGYGPDRRARTGLLLSWVGVGLTLPYYGAEVFGLHAAGQQAVTSGDTAVFDSLTHDIRWEAGIWFILAGLLLLAAGTVTVAAAAWHSAVLPRWSAVPLAVVLALYIPQFAASQPVRVAHGVLLALACAWLARAALRSAAEPPATHRSYQPEVGRP